MAATIEQIQEILFELAKERKEAEVRWERQRTEREALEEKKRQELEARWERERIEREKQQSERERKREEQRIAWQKEIERTLAAFEEKRNIEYEKTQAQFKQTDIKIQKATDLFESQWGKLVESLVEGDLVVILN